MDQKEVVSLISAVRQRVAEKNALASRLNELSAGGKLTPNIAQVKLLIEDQKLYLKTMATEIENKYDDPIYDDM